ncbi:MULTISPECIES: phage tail tube protein [Asaia]|uniref:phage tail tube protein n=1 Tax=Asaia TaxID=91914 RepID=UPI002FC33E0B
MSDTRQTAGWAAGLLCDRSAFAIAAEPSYGAMPSSFYQQLRLSGVNLALSQDRAWPEERNPRAERAGGVTTGLAGSGTLNGLLSFGSPNVLLAAALGSVWQKGTISNDTMRRSWTLRQRLGEGWLYRQGLVIRRLTLNIVQGGFAEVACDVIYAREVIIPDDEAAADDPPPSRMPMHSSRARIALALPGLVDPGVLRSISIIFGRDDAALDYGAGSLLANDIRPGLFAATGSIEVMLRGHDAYAALQSAAAGPLSLTVTDQDGYGYAITIPRAVICNPRLNASSRGAILIAAFDIEALPGGSEGGMISVSMLQPDDYRLISVNQKPILNNNQTISP